MADNQNSFFKNNHCMSTNKYYYRNYSDKPEKINFIKELSIMKTYIRIFTYALLLILSSCNTQKTEIGKELFDFDWKFKLNDQVNAEKSDFDDSDWRILNLPHDFSIEQPFDSSNFTGPDGGYTYNGIGWYRKHFILPKTSGNKNIMVQFNGIYRNSEVWINGHYLGFRPYGYTSFYYNLTPYLNKPGTDNILAVKVNTSEQPNSRWYTGAGIYRHVWLYTTEKIHFKHWGVYAQTAYSNSTEAKIIISSDIVNGLTKPVKVRVHCKLLNKEDAIAGECISDLSIEADSSANIIQEILVKKPMLWSVDDPDLYKLECTIIKDQKVQDLYTSSYGIRTVVFYPDSGCYINDKHVLLKGTNNHHDGGPLGAACADYSFERQLRILKNMGCNALRISHNPPAPELLDCADSMGFVVINEIFDEWVSWKRKTGYSPHFYEWYKKDVANWILRDRNHPCVVAWSLGNEVIEQRRKDGSQILQLIKNEAIKYDTTRPFTAGCNEMPAANKNGFTPLLNIVGYNYRESMYESDHVQYPERVIFGSETVIYPYHPGEDFPLHTQKQWIDAQHSKYIAGEFIWTGFDYLGETGIGLGGTSYEPWLYWPKWPYRSAVCGVIDICGFEKPGYWFRKALWSDEPVVFIAVGLDSAAFNEKAVPFWGWPNVLDHWNHTIEGDSLPVQVYTNCENVELFINDKSFGVKTLDKTKEAFLIWKVPFEPGIIKAVATNTSGIQIVHKIKTAGAPAKIVLNTKKPTVKADWQDVTYIKATVTDQYDVPVPFASNIIEFSVKGEGKIRAVGNGDPKSHTFFGGKTIEAYQGKCLVIVQSGKKEGKIIVKASSPGLKGSEKEIISVKN